MSHRIILSAFILLSLPWFCSAQTNALTYHNDNFHTGQNLSERILTPANVNARNFGKLFFLPADGKVEAQPLYVAGLNIPNQEAYNVVFMATEHGTVYAYDADGPGAPLWQVSMLGPGETPSGDIGCFQVSPEIGVTSTPVIDLSAGDHGTMYVVAMSVDSDGRYHQRLHALDITSGQEEFGGPVEITATFPGDGDGGRGGLLQFDPKMYKERAALVLSNGIVYTSWASHCDFRPYTGWVIGYDQYTLSQMLVYNFTPNGLGGSLWGAGSGPAVDSTGTLFFQTANGTFDSDLDTVGFPTRDDYGNSFVKLSADRNFPGVMDYWTMYNTVLQSGSGRRSWLGWHHAASRSCRRRRTPSRLCCTPTMRRISLSSCTTATRLRTAVTTPAARAANGLHRRLLTAKFSCPRPAVSASSGSSTKLRSRRA